MTDERTNLFSIKAEELYFTYDRHIQYDAGSYFLKLFWFQK